MFTKYDAKLDLRISKEYKEFLRQLSLEAKQPMSKLAREYLESTLRKIYRKKFSNKDAQSDALPPSGENNSGAGE